MKLKSLSAFALAAALCAPALAQNQYIFGFSSNSSTTNALTINGSTEVRPFDAGWYADGTWSHNPSNDNYIVGLCTSCADAGYYNNFFVFDISGLAGTTVTSASFKLYSFDVTLKEGLYSMFDVRTSIDSLLAGTGGEAAFNDLAGGTAYGARVYQVTESNTFHTISLYGGAIDNLNAAIARGDSNWAIGGTFQPGVIEVPPVPEPGTVALMLAGLGIVGLVARRRRS
jgi:PEP-CTERM motif